MLYYIIKSWISQVGGDKNPQKSGGVVMSELRELARFLTRLSWENLPEKVRETAGLLLLDNLGAALGAVKTPLPQAAAATLLPLAGEGGRASLWGRGRKAPLSTAVFLNALLTDALGLDDLHTGSKTHIGTVVIPAAWGMAEQMGKSGKELLLAVVCGYETMARVGKALGVASHRKQGWHATATAGTFGAAAACGKLLGLDEEGMVSALGLAGSQSFGVWAFLGDGTNSKSLNPARAAASGCEAALLAQAGMTGPEHILTAEDGGLIRAMSREGDASPVAGELGETWEICRMDNRPYPCARSTHGAVDGALELRREHGLSPEEIDWVWVDTYQVGFQQCGTGEGSLRPKTPAQAKFSTPYCVACALLYGEVGLPHFTQEWVERAEVQEFLPRVAVTEDATLTAAYPRHWGSRVTIECKDGRKVSTLVSDASGSVDNPLSREQVKAKAVGLFRETRGEDAPALAERLLALEKAEKLPEL